MHPEQIKAAMRMAGTTQAMLADELKLSRSTVTQVVNGTGKSARVMARISEITGKSISTLWPASVKPSLVVRRTKAVTGATA